MISTSLTSLCVIPAFGWLTGINARGVSTEVLYCSLCYRFGPACQLNRCLGLSPSAMYRANGRPRYPLLSVGSIVRSPSGTRTTPTTIYQTRGEGRGDGQRSQELGLATRG